MEHDVSVVGISIVGMGVPALRMKIDFDVAANRGRGIKLDHTVAEVGSRLVVPESGMQNAYRSAIKSGKMFTAESLMLPYRLQQPFAQD